MNLSDYACIYLSVFKHIEDSFTTKGLIVSGTIGGVTLMDAYPDNDQIKKMVYLSDATGSSDEVVLPVISIEQGGPINTNAFELGSTNTNLQYPVSLTVFAETHIQSMQLAGALHNTLLKEEINYYDYDYNFTNPITSGTLLVENYRTVPVNFTGDENRFLRFGNDVFFDIRRVID